MSIDKVVKGIKIIDLHKLDSDFSGIKDEKLITLAEKTLDLKFPDDYRFFLQVLGCGEVDQEI